MGGLETFLITPGSVSKDIFVIHFHNGRGTSVLCLRRCKTLGPFPPAEGLTFNISVCGSVFYMKGVDVVHLCSQGCASLPALPCLAGPLWEPVAQGQRQGTLTVLWPPRHFCLPKSPTGTQEKGWSEESLWFISFPLISAGRLFGLFFKLFGEFWWRSTVVLSLALCFMTDISAH